jgi:ketosteroid isomerase-like protein
VKVCPQCGTRYTDETLRYCLQDGRKLQQVDSVPSVPPVDEPDTVVRKRPMDNDVLLNVNRPKTGWIVALTALTTLLLVVFGVAAWLFFRRASSQPDNVQNTTANTAPTPERFPSPTPSPTANSSGINAPVNSAIPGPVDAARVRREVTQFIANWKSATESKDIDSYMGQYADTVAYYNNPSASRDEVQNDKRRAFSLYEYIRLNISNISTELGPNGETAVSTFDKEWEFVGERESKGKVRSELRLKKFDDKWKIVGERDQRVYYVE